MSRKKPASSSAERPRLRMQAEEALAKLQERIAAGGELRYRRTYDEADVDDLKNDYATWHGGNRALLRQMFTTDEYADNYYRTYDISRYGDWVVQLEEYHDRISDRVRRLQGVLEQLPFVDVAEDDQREKADATDASRLNRILTHFHIVARRMRRRHKSRPTLDVQDEYDVQDLLSSILAVDFDDIRLEEWTPSYAGGSSRTDFLLKQQNTVVEVKLASPRHAERAIRDELAIDLIRYRAHGDCRTLVCFVYDPLGVIDNPEGLRSDLEKASSEALRVVVVVNPT